MRQRSDLIYVYDGSYEGFLCCVFEAFLAKERPFDILTEDRLEPTLFSVKCRSAGKRRFPEGAATHVPGSAGRSR